MHIVAHRLQITAAAPVHDERFVTSAEQMSKLPVTPVKSRRISAKKPFHPRNQVGLWRLDDQMKMIVHQAIRVNLPARFDARLRQRFQKPPPVGVIMIYRLATVAAIHQTCLAVAFSEGG